VGGSRDTISNTAPIQEDAGRIAVTPGMKPSPPSGQCRSLFLITFGFALVASLTVARAELIHRFSFTDDAADSIGGASADLRGGATVFQGAVHLDGVDDYVNLAIGGTISELQSCSFEIWVIWPEFRDPWSRIFDFGHDENVWMFLTPRNGLAENYGSTVTDTPRFSMTLARVPGADQATSPRAMRTGVEIHFVVTIDAVAGVARLYENGVSVGVEPDLSLTPSDLGNTPNNWLGRSQYSHDAFFRGSISEFRVHDSALTPEQVSRSFEAGPDDLTLTVADCDLDGVSDEEEIALGAETDCNGNGVPDSCDLEERDSSDHDHNGIPDECQALAGRFEFVPAGDSCVVILLQAAVPSKGGEIGFTYDSNRMTPFRVEPGADFPGAADDIFAVFDALSQCTELGETTKGVVVGWVNEGTGAILPAGEYELLRICFNAADTPEGGSCSALEFVNCLGVPEAPVVNKLTGEANQVVLVDTLNGEICSSRDPFRRGDADANGVFDLTDPIFVLGCQFLGSDCPSCLDAADVNDDGRVDLSDAVALLTWRFLGSAPPASPFATCGFDQTEDELGECSFPACRG
jgi:hypothetical protein